MPKRDYRSYNILENELANSESYSKDSIDLVQPMQKEKTLDRENGYESENKSEDESKEKLEEENAEEQIKEHVEECIGGTIKDKPFWGEKKQEQQKENDIEKNLDYPAYKKYYHQKERSKIFKLIMVLARIICFIMLLPVIGIVVFGALIAVGSIALTIVASIGAGIFILGAVCFMLSQLSFNLVALGITFSITLIAFGGIVLILIIMFIKWIKGLVRKNKRLQGKLVKEDR